MQNIYSGIEEFECDAQAWGFVPADLLADGVYSRLSDGRIKREFSGFVDGKPVY